MKWGILGAAAIARKNVRAMLQVPEEAELVAIGSRSAEKAKRFLKDMQKHGLSNKVKYYSSYEEVIKDDNVEAVYIPLPTPLHYEWVIKAANSKKHILVEKPIAMTRIELEEMIKCCEDNGVLFMDGTMWLHHPRTKELEDILDSGTLGDLRRVDAALSFCGSEKFFNTDIRTNYDLDGKLGCVGDVGWYTFSAMLWAMRYKKPSTVQVDSCPRFARGWGNDSEEPCIPVHVSGSIVWEDGVRGQFDCSFDTCFRQRLAVAGTIGEFSLSDFVIANDYKYIVERNAGVCDDFTKVTGDRTTHSVPGDFPQEVYMIRNFNRIRNNVEERKKWANRSKATMNILFAVMDAIKTNPILAQNV